MSREDAVTIKSIPQLVLGKLVRRLIARDSVKCVIDYLMTSPRGELEHAPYHVVHNIVIVLREWVEMFAETQSGGSADRTGLDAPTITQSLLAHARKITTDKGADGGREDFDSIDSYFNSDDDLNANTGTSQPKTLQQEIDAISPAAYDKTLRLGDTAMKLLGAKQELADVRAEMQSRREQEKDANETPAES